MEIMSSLNNNDVTPFDANNSTKMTPINQTVMNEGMAPINEWGGMTQIPNLNETNEINMAHIDSSTNSTKSPPQPETNEDDSEESWMNRVNRLKEERGE